MFGMFFAVSVPIVILIAVLSIMAGAVCAFLVIRYLYKKTGKDATKIIDDAKKAAEDNRKREVLETKQELYKLKQESEKDIQPANPLFRFDGNFFLDALFQRNERFSSSYTRNFLNLGVQQVHQMFIIT